MQESMLPLLSTLAPMGSNEDHPNSEIFQHPSQMAEGVGQLTVLHYNNLLLVNIQETQDHAGRGEHLGGDEPPLEFRAKFHLIAGKLIEPEHLYPRAMSVSLRDYGKRASGLYHPYRWPDGGISLHFDMFGSLSQGGLERVQTIVTYMVSSATSYVENILTDIPA